MHLDIHVSDPNAEADRLVALGATRLGEGSLGEHRWITMTDPEGNEFFGVRQLHPVPSTRRRTRYDDDYWVRARRPAQRAMQAMMGMVKLSIPDLEAAYHGTTTP